MKKHIEENGIHYTLGANGLYYPDLMLPEGTLHQIGRYGRMRAEFVKKHRHEMYLELLFAGKWNEYLHDIEEECYQRKDVLVKKIKTGAGITEKLKANDQMRWIGLMNNVRSSVEEILLQNLVYNIG